MIINTRTPTTAVKMMSLHEHLHSSTAMKKIKTARLLGSLMLMTYWHANNYKNIWLDLDQDNFSHREYLHVSP